MSILPISLFLCAAIFISVYSIWRWRWGRMRIYARWGETFQDRAINPWATHSDERMPSEFDLFDMKERSKSVKGDTAFAKGRDVDVGGMGAQKGRTPPTSRH